MKDNNPNQPPNKSERAIDFILNVIYWLAIGLFVIVFAIHIMSVRQPLIIPTPDNIKQIESVLSRYPNKH